MPRKVTIYPASGGGLQLLWLDQTALGDTYLMGAFLGQNGDLERGPAAISSKPVSDYRAAATPDGEVIALWVQTGDHPTPLYAQLIDRAGRALPPVRLASSGRFPWQFTRRMERCTSRGWN